MAGLAVLISTLSPTYAWTQPCEAEGKKFRDSFHYRDCEYMYTKVDKKGKITPDSEKKVKSCIKEYEKELRREYEVCIRNYQDLFDRCIKKVDSKIREAISNPIIYCSGGFFGGAHCYTDTPSYDKYEEREKNKCEILRPDKSYLPLREIE